MQRRLSVPIAALACMLLAACASRPPIATDTDTDTDTATFIVVRHAEKVDASRDPALGAAGHARARALAQRLDGTPLVAAYATEFKRTGQTLAPTVQAHGLATAAYAASEPAAEFAARLRAAHPRGTVLVAGHSNTVPDIVAALCGCIVAPMPDHEYDRLSIIHVAADGPPRLAVERYGDPTP